MDTVVCCHSCNAVCCWWLSFTYCSILFSIVIHILHFAVSDCHSHTEVYCFHLPITYQSILLLIVVCILWHTLSIVILYTVHCCSTCWILIIPIINYILVHCHSYISVLIITSYYLYIIRQTNDSYLDQLMIVTSKNAKHTCITFRHHINQ